MPARLRKHHQDEIRSKIQVSQLLNVLHGQALGKDPEIGQARMKAIEILLRKSLPDLSQVDVEHSGETGLTIKVVQFGSHSPE